MYAGAIVGGYMTCSLDSVAVWLATSIITLCGGHSLGMHRRLIHKSFECPLWLEHLMVYLGTLVGMAGPYGMIRTHDLRDWAQRQTNCHNYFAHRESPLVDAFQQMHCGTFTTLTK
jgi:stearoyl-CoA desaturase (delta-9 desaturase)